jgi:hypothetical protein
MVRSEEIPEVSKFSNVDFPTMTIDALNLNGFFCPVSHRGWWASRSDRASSGSDASPAGTNERGRQLRRPLITRSIFFACRVWI